MLHNDTVFRWIAVIVVVVIWLAIAAAAVYLFVLIVKALRKYIASKEVREEKAQIKKSLSEILKENRIRCKMTQEFVAEAIGVSRQAVSKWENGSSDPSTSNLIALAQLYGVSAEEMIQTVTRNHPQDEQSNSNSEEK